MGGIIVSLFFFCFYREERDSDMTPVTLYIEFMDHRCWNIVQREDGLYDSTLYSEFEDCLMDVQGITFDALPNYQSKGIFEINYFIGDDVYLITKESLSHPLEIESDVYQLLTRLHDTSKINLNTLEER